MASLRLLVIAALLTSIAAGQTEQVSNPSSLTIVKSSWNPSVNPRDTDYPEPNDASTHNPPRLVRPPSEQPLLTKAPDTRGFQYKLTIRNNGAKTITGLVWDYVFFDSKGSEVGRHHFENIKDLKIKSGKSKQITNFSISHPIRVVSANELGNDKKMTSRIEIERIEYVDGDCWQRPHH